MWVCERESEVAYVYLKEKEREWCSGNLCKREIVIYCVCVCVCVWVWKREWTSVCVSECVVLRRLISRAEPPTFVAPSLLFEKRKSPAERDYLCPYVCLCKREREKDNYRFINFFKLQFFPIYENFYSPYINQLYFLSFPIKNKRFEYKSR